MRMNFDCKFKSEYNLEKCKMKRIKQKPIDVYLYRRTLKLRKFLWNPQLHGHRELSGSSHLSEVHGNELQLLRLTVARVVVACNFTQHRFPGYSG
jgi:hypothetical protein